MPENILYDIEDLNAAVKEIPTGGAVRCEVLARSILGREIPVFTLGTGRKTVLYVGAHHGTDALSPAVLLEFIRDYALQYEKKATVYDIGITNLAAERRIVVVPLLNPDGAAYVKEGVLTNNPLYTRVMQMNGGERFSDWAANARGVDLARNYDSDFGARKDAEQRAGLLNGAGAGYSGEYPESEPETAALCRYLRFFEEELLGVLELDMGEERILCSCQDKLSAKTMAAGRILARALGYRGKGPDMTSPTGSLADWCIERLSRPAYRVFLPPMREDIPSPRAVAFEKARRALYTFPFML